MRYGYWLPVFGGWLRNIEDEAMEATWAYNSRLARRSEEIGYDLTLIAELNLNDIKGAEAPSLAERVREFEDAGVDLLLLQCSPQLEEMERFAETVIERKERVQPQPITSQAAHAVGRTIS